MSTLDELLAELKQRREVLLAARERVDETEQEVLEERFRDVPRWAVGDVILVQRVLFGKPRMWPAKVRTVHLRYSEGHYPETYAIDPGGHWENKTISYSVYLQQKDGTFSGTSFSAWHTETDPFTIKPEASA